jgi:hypothetical protein
VRRFGTRVNAAEGIKRTQSDSMSVREEQTRGDFRARIFDLEAQV